jgi:hypothetical protein
MPVDAAIRLTYQAKHTKDKDVRVANAEGDGLAAALSVTVKKLDARTGKHNHVSADIYKLYLNEILYYIDSDTIIPKSNPSEICKPTPAETLPYEDVYYRCDGDDIYSSSGVLFFFNTNFASVGTYELNIKEPENYFVNKVDAISVYDKDRNELLVTASYTLIDTSYTITKRPDREEGVFYDERRSTILLRLKVIDGKIQVEQDDTCLKNPNKISNIATARKLLKLCEANNQNLAKSKIPQITLQPKITH